MAAAAVPPEQAGPSDLQAPSEGDQGPKKASKLILQHEIYEGLFAVKRPALACSATCSGGMYAAVPSTGPMRVRRVSKRSTGEAGQGGLPIFGSIWAARS